MNKSTDHKAIDASTASLLVLQVDLFNPDTGGEEIQSENLKKKNCTNLTKIFEIRIIHSRARYPVGA